LDTLKKNNRTFIPGIFTTFNLFFGFLAVIKISEGNFVTGCWLIVFAGVFDAFDGQLARFTNSSSAFGIEFDSLADIISFGAAPSFLLHEIYFKSFGILGIIISFSPLIFGGIRLARFNINLDGFKKTVFVGLPIPIAAISFATFVIFNYHFWGDIHLIRILGPQIVIVCLLMISYVEYDSFPKLTFKQGRDNSIQLVVFLIIITTLALYPHETFYPISLVYITWGMIRSFSGIRPGKRERKTTQTDIT
jgi:CDP-diacylglycerol--serine O-phosphatidyltransferase